MTVRLHDLQGCLPHMIERRSGAVVNLTSKNVARRGRAGQSSYGAAKAVVGRLSESLADEVEVWRSWFRKSMRFSSHSRKRGNCGE